ncbi:Bacteriophage abortive infection AbiH [Lishizhenia tianjinensis]|uniref:Bacteriophage abortive infection AbiH n=1 Tax=Lishizhenia tianjinensis TaxID=477690 RepID=A0A1I6XLC2_9FLAO|nr:AbiH family protein [Lishizhenia tianjinensis]SFT38907.1 Bacteriophage abortive infection AbiH [Lishizhenia tianjinensis]
MNRIILLGNGFDLVNDFESSYNNFLRHLRDETIKDLEINGTGNRYNNGIVDLKSIGNPIKEINHFNAIQILFRGNNFGNDIFEARICNKFLQRLIKKQRIQNWVDIEQEYYELLINIFLQKEGFITIDELNEDLTFITNKLIEFLKIKESKFTEKLNALDPMDSDFNKLQNITQNLLDDINVFHLAPKVINQYFTMIGEELLLNTESITETNNKFEFKAKYKEDLSAELNEYCLNNGIEQARLKDVNKVLDRYEKSTSQLNELVSISPENILVVNFNYTNTLKLIIDWLITMEKISTDRTKNIRILNIHGKLKSRDSIIFGFGDETDSQYSSIENSKKDDYMLNFKSINYLNSFGYRSLLEFLETENYQVYTVGLSFGQSDKTLLNTIFEHDNCVSIKPFYRKIDNDNDNYSKLAMAISRNFRSKAKLRERVVSKVLCKSIIE